MLAARIFSMFRHRISLVSFIILLYATGHSLAQPTTVYSNNAAVSDARGLPRDSSTFYFPITDSIPVGYPSDDKRLAEHQMEERYCSALLKEASTCLVYFQAPVFFNYYLHADIYRFLWLRAFHRPVLLTLRQDSTGIILRTQFLSKHPLAGQLAFMDPDEPGISAEAAAVRRKNTTEMMADPAFMKQMAESKRHAVQVTKEETYRAVTLEQWQHFQELLRQSNFRQMASCQPKLMLDGAEWLLEGHGADGYHAVLRQSPDKKDTFRTACEYLLDLSSARKEKRY